MSLTVLHFLVTGLLIVLPLIRCVCCTIATVADLGRLHLRIATYNNPLANLSGVPISNIGLIETELLELISKRLDFTYEICVPEDVHQLGLRHSNGSWSGVLGLIHKGTADLSISYGPRNLQKYLVFGTTASIIADNIVMMIPLPTSQLHPSSMLNVFQPLVWILFASSTIIVIGFIWLLRMLGSRDSKALYSLHYYMLGVSFSQGGWLPQDSTALRVTLSAWMLSFVVMNYAYTGCLISKITMPNYEFLARSIIDVASNIQILPVVWKGSSAHSEFKESIQCSFSEINRRLEKHPELLLSAGMNQVVDLVQNKTQHFVIFGGDINLHQHLQKDYDQYNKCRSLILDSTPVRKQSNCLFMSKNINANLKTMLNRELLLLRDHGIAQHLETKHRALCMKRCTIPVKRVNKNPPSVLTLRQLKGGFYLLALGIALSLTAFIFEHIRHLLLSLKANAKCKMMDRTMVVREPSPIKKLKREQQDDPPVDEEAGATLDGRPVTEITDTTAISKVVVVIEVSAVLNDGQHQHHQSTNDNS